MTQLTGLAAALLGLVVAGAASHPAAPVSDAFRKSAERAERNLVEAAEAMPAGKYGFKPTAAQMTFGAVVAHLAEGNDYLCSTISGTPAPKRSPVAAEAPKRQLVDRLKETFRFCDTALAKVDDSALGVEVPFFGDRKLSRAAVMFLTAEDWADHYSQVAGYLRLNGLLPPTAKRRAE